MKDGVEHSSSCQGLFKAARGKPALSLSFSFSVLLLCRSCAFSLTPTAPHKLLLFRSWDCAFGMIVSRYSSGAIAMSK